MSLKYDVLIFTSNKEKAEQILKELKVSLSQIKVTVLTEEAMKFLAFE